jgi:arginase
MKRRQFLKSSAAAIGTQLFAGHVIGQGQTRPDVSVPTYRLLGVPLRAGSLLPGNENDAQAYREVQLLKRLEAVGCKAIDDGDIAIPSYLPHHSIPPIRSWPHLELPGNASPSVSCRC